jgi:hypothetical protein
MANGRPTRTRRIPTPPPRIQPVTLYDAAGRVTGILDPIRRQTRPAPPGRPSRTA